MCECTGRATLRPTELTILFGTVSSRETNLCHVQYSRRVRHDFTCGKIIYFCTPSHRLVSHNTHTRLQSVCELRKNALGPAEASTLAQSTKCYSIDESLSYTKPK